MWHEFDLEKLPTPFPHPPTHPSCLVFVNISIRKCSPIFHCFVIVMNRTFPSCTPQNMLNKTTKIFPSSRICTPHNSSKTCSNHRIGEVGQKFSCRGRKYFQSFFFKLWQLRYSNIYSFGIFRSAR